MAALLDLSDVRRSFGAVAALAGVTLEIDAGEIVCLVGRSGCGKSTLLRTIAGVETVDAGSIVLAGRTLAGPGTFVEPEQRQVGLMFQDYALFPHLTTQRNVEFGLKALSGAERRSRAGSVIDRLGIAALAGRYPHELSGGEQQRVALARALAPRPRVLLMDEPFSNLDRGLRDDVRHETIALLRGFGATTIIVTHDPEEALGIADRVVLMHEGSVVQAGSASDLYDRPRTPFAAAFFSRVNRVPALHRDGRLETPLGTFAAPLSSERTPSVLVRPEALRVGAAGPEATVVRKVLLGEVEELGLTVAGLEFPLVARSSRRSGLEVGGSTTVTVEPGGVMIFSGDSEQIRNADLPEWRNDG